MPEQPKTSALRGFRPPLWAWIVTPLTMALMVSLGAWQLDRAAQKQQMKAEFAAATSTSPDPLPTPAPAATQAPEAVTVKGHFLPDKQLLLDSQIRDGVAGVRVWTALQRPGGGIILVDRGWTVDPGRGDVPAIDIAANERQVRGLWRPLPRAGVTVANRLCGNGAASTPRVQYPTHAQLQCAFHGRLANGLLLMDADEPDGFRREWAPDHLKPEVHWGYAVQWFAFALAVLVIFVVVNWKKR